MGVSIALKCFWAVSGGVELGGMCLEGGSGSQGPIEQRTRDSGDWSLCATVICRMWRQVRDVSGRVEGGGVSSVLWVGLRGGVNSGEGSVAAGGGGEGGNW
ncbi:unnamed protein product [Prunus armeniaca]|uniref:Uncharacterized protein n=1 Tax=Prunus armeniaca TaxID=36596 RepID=A0A6J5Y159_PRUAR|nr:unnamed protein product [Prunus armeniaca]